MIEKRKWLLAVTSSEVRNSVSTVTDESNSFSVSTSSYWSPEDGEELNNKLKDFLDLRSENDIELLKKEVE